MYNRSGAVALLKWRWYLQTMIKLLRRRVGLFASIVMLAGAVPALGQPATPPGNASAPGARDQPVQQPSSEVRVSEYGTVDIIAQNDNIRNVLQKLAVQARRNIVPSFSVDRTISATIYGAPFYDALDALLNTNGLGYIERGEFLYIYTAEELVELRVQERRAVTRIMHLDYLRSDDARMFATALLSPIGTIEATRDSAGDSSGGSGGGGGQADLLTQASTRSQTDPYTIGNESYSLRNAVIIRDYPEHVEEIEALLRELDTRPAQVLLECTILQTTLNEANAFGVDFAILSDVQFTDFFNFPASFNPLNFLRTTGEDADNIPNVNNRSFVGATPGNTGLGQANIRGGVVAGDVAIFIRALDSVTDVTLLSNPKVLALNRQRARVLVGTRVGYLETTIVENQILQTVQFLDTGIGLDIRPAIMRDELVRLEIAPRVSQVVFREIQSADGITQVIPDENIQVVTTHVTVPGGYTAVIGGLFREDTSRARSQVPVLGDIPLIGAAFSGYDNQLEQVEIIFLIKPTVMADRLIREHGEKAIEYTERVRIGSRLGLLPWSRERQSAQLNLKAEQLAQQGKINAANWHIRRSLELHPVQPDAIRISESLAAGKQWWPTRSILHRIINDEYLDAFESEFPGHDMQESEPSSDETRSDDSTDLSETSKPIHPGED